MSIFRTIGKKMGFSLKYSGHEEAVIISCFFNPMNSPYRLKAFRTFYDSIKHLNHQITECVIGDGRPQLAEIVNPNNYDVIHSDSMLWHKETLLNRTIATLSRKYKYVFWVDADVIFRNPDWMIEGVEQLKLKNIIQPFEYCVHLDKDEKRPASFDLAIAERSDGLRKVWKSFCATFNTDRKMAEDKKYDRHGHVGFAWGARRDVLDFIPLYDKALIGGADHIIAHAAAGHIPHSCITNAFKDDIDNVLEWSKRFFHIVRGQIGYVSGDLYHIWHGDIDKRQYLKRVKDFTIQTKKISKKDRNGLYVSTKGDDHYVRKYFEEREVIPSHDDGFLTSMALGYLTDSPIIGGLVGGNFLGSVVGSSLRDDNNERRKSPPVEATRQSKIYQNSNEEVDVPVIAPDIDNDNDMPSMVLPAILSSNSQTNQSQTQETPMLLEDPEPPSTDMPSTDYIPSNDADIPADPDANSGDVASADNDCGAFS